MEQKMLEKYARLLVKTGINIQKGQTLVINSPIETAPFARMIAERAYEAGAREVVIRWSDELSTKMKYLHANDEVFDEYPDWAKEFSLSYANKGAAFLSISASDPELMKDVNPTRMARQQKVASVALKGYRERMMSNKNTWCIASVPTVAWAKKVFPNVTQEEAVEQLWSAIFKAIRVDMDDPVAAWEKHKNNLKNSMNFLNKHNFKYLTFKNDLGTDLEVELPEGYLFVGGSEFTPKNSEFPETEFIANMPTEEVFSMPKKTGVNGVVYSSKPLNYRGTLIDQFSLTFKDGEIVDYSAEVGYESLKSLIETDEGSRYLGEVALVPYDSPISQSGVLFYNTLYDENASCHLAIGKAYPVCIQGGENMTSKELEQHGVNESITHVDFMFGTKDLQVIGTTHDGQKVTVFKDGNFAF